MSAQAVYVEGTVEELEEVLRREFDLAVRALADARRAQHRKDTPANRLQVDDCRSEVDVVLDVWNAAVPAGR